MSKHARLPVLLVVVALVLAACGNASNSTTSQTTSAPATGSGSAVTTASPAQLKQHDPITETGVTDTTIRVGSVASITNPLGGNYGALNDGIEAYFKMVDSQGGIYGRQLELTSKRDDAVAKNQTEVQAMLSQDNVFAVFVATLLFTGANVLAAQNVPTFGWNINPEWTGHDTMFPNLTALCFGCTGQIVPWLAQKLGKHKVGILAYGVSSESKLCAVGDKASFEKYPTAKVVYYDDSLPFGVPDLSQQVAAMKQKGVDFITTCMDQNGVFTLAKEMKKQGLDAVQHMPNSYDQSFMKANGSYFQGDIVVPGFTAFENTPRTAEMQAFFKWMKETGKQPVELSMQGWIAADQFVTGLKLAGPDFSRAKVVAGLNRVTDYTAGGLLPPLDWTTGHRDPKKFPPPKGSLNCANFVKVTAQNTFEPVFGEPSKPWVCFPNDAATLQQPSYHSFTEGLSGL